MKLFECAKMDTGNKPVDCGLSNTNRPKMLCPITCQCKERDEERGSVCWGISENSDKVPEYERRKYSNVQVRSTDDARGDKESPKDCSRLKSCEFFYTCPRAPKEYS
jgi:hypothetical protein